MPIPKPRDNEKEDEFISRCMGEETMNKEYPENDQRSAICNEQWRRSREKGMFKLEYKTIPFEVKALNESTGEFEGYAAVFRDSPDRVGDIIAPGAFENTIKADGGKVALFWMHNVTEPLGMATISEDEHGLKVKGQLTRGVQKAEEVLLLMKAGVVRRMSIGYDVIKREFKEGIRHLLELDVPDVSLVAGNLAVDDQAVVTAMKSMTYQEEVDSVLAAVEDLLARTKSLADLRREDGRQLSEGHREELVKLEGALGEIKALLDEINAPNYDQIASLWLQWEATRRKLQEIAI